jgi:hypothetical protein
MIANDLRDVLLGLPELTLIGTALLEASTGFFPVDVPRDTLREAVVDADIRCCGWLTPLPSHTLQAALSGQPSLSLDFYSYGVMLRKHEGYTLRLSYSASAV